MTKRVELNWREMAAILEREVPARTGEPRHVIVNAMAEWAEANAGVRWYGVNIFETAQMVICLSAFTGKHLDGLAAVAAATTVQVLLELLAMAVGPRPALNLVSRFVHDKLKREIRFRPAKEQPTNGA